MWLILLYGVAPLVFGLIAGKLITRYDTKKGKARAAAIAAASVPEEYTI